MLEKYLFQVSVNARRIVAALGCSCLGALAAVGGGAQAAAALTSTAVTDGYGLATFVAGITGGNPCCGPVGVYNTTGGNIMIGNYGTGRSRAFGDTNGQVWTSGTVAATNYGGSNVTGFASLGGNFYAAEQSRGKVITIDAGNRTSDLASIVGATGIVGDAATGLLYVSNGVSVSSVNPIGGAVSLFASQGADGLSLSADGSILYMAINGTGHLLGFNTSTHLQVFDSGFIASGPSLGIDGTALGSGTLAGNIFVNTNGGLLIKVNLTTLAQTVLVSGGSRGDFVTVDANDGTLLFTQTDSVMRLTAPTGGGFVGNVPGTGVVPRC